MSECTYVYVCVYKFECKKLRINYVQIYECMNVYVCMCASMYEFMYVFMLV